LTKFLKNVIILLSDRKRFPKILEKERGKTMTIIKELNGLTVGELKTILEQVPDEVEICVWSPNVDWVELEVNIYTEEESDVFINIETKSPY